MKSPARSDTAGHDDVEEELIDPAALDRLAEVRVLTLVHAGGLDLQRSTRLPARDRRDRPRQRTRAP